MVYRSPAQIHLVNNRPWEGKSANFQGLDAGQRLKLRGFVCRESAASAAVASFSLRSGTLTTDPLLFPVELLANESRSEWFPDDGIPVDAGVFVRVESGTVDIVFFYDQD